jgi:NTP pyrophosphatase (non-canonical NTP hydrolase)
VGFPVSVQCFKCQSTGPERLTGREADQAWNDRIAFQIGEHGTAQIVINEEVRREMARAIRKFPTWPTDPMHALGVVNEEQGELAKALLEHIYAEGPLGEVSKEAIQLAAMALRFAYSLDRYAFTRSPQHAQTQVNL